MGNVYFLSLETQGCSNSISANEKGFVQVGE